MASPKFDRQRAGKLLAEAALAGDEATARAHGISVRSLQRWRARLGDDSKLSQVVAEKKAVIDEAWAHRIAPALKGAIAFLERSFDQADPRDPDAIHAVAGAFKLLTDAEATQRVLDVRLSREARPPGAVHRPVAPAGAGDSTVVQ